MLKRDRVTLINTSEGTTDEYGGYVVGTETSETLMCNIQPFSRELLLKKYGFDIEVTKLMICSVDNDIKEGSIIIYNKKKYEVKKIPWDVSHFEVMLNAI